MRALSRRKSARFVAGVALAIAAVSMVATSASGHGTATAPPGQTLFTSSGCGGCHTFKALGAKGTIGPNLDKVKLTLAQMKTAISKGGSAVMTKAQVAKYKFKMTPFAGRLSAAKIATLAAFVVKERDKPLLASAKTTTTGSGSSSSSSSSSSSGSSGSTTTTAATTTTKSGGGGGGTVNPCPPGQTIQTAGNSDADGDEQGTEPDDNDGCI